MNLGFGHGWAPCSQVTFYPVPTAKAPCSGRKATPRQPLSSLEGHWLPWKFLLTQTFLYCPALERAINNSNTASFYVPEFGDISPQQPVMLNFSLEVFQGLLIRQQWKGCETGAQAVECRDTWQGRPMCSVRTEWRQL